jgi:hypothetical protein
MARKAPVKDVEITTTSEKTVRGVVVNKPTNHLRLKLDDLKTFDPLTNNQKLFFDAYKRGDYFVALHGVA